MNKLAGAKRALLVGAAGFVGGWLAEYLHKNTNWELYATKLPGERLDIPYVHSLDLDVTDAKAVEGLVGDLQPGVIFHLAAQSSVGLSWKNPTLTVDVNINGALHLLDAVRKATYAPRILLIGSGEEYGPVRPEDIPVNEQVVPKPGNVYAITKNAQNQLGSLYAKAYDMDIICTRSFNHVGPRQSPAFVVADFCKQVAEIEAGRRDAVLRVGNLAAKRDFTDVRDVVAAYLLLAEKAEKGTFNVGSGQATSIQHILDSILALGKVDIKVEVDPSKFRPVDVPVIEADVTKLKVATGWAPQYELQQTLCETLGYWRQSISG